MRWDIGIDLGTENIRMTEAGHGPTLDAPALLALRESDEEGNSFAAGPAAYALLGRACQGVQVVRPLRDGVLENNLYAERLLRWALQQQDESRRVRRPAVLITHAPHARPVQKEALLRAALNAGAAEASLIRSDVAAALGTGLDLLAPEAKLVVDVGAGSITASVFTMGRLAASETLPYGLDRVDETLIHLLRTEDGFAIGQRTAAELKQMLGSALPPAAETAPMKAAGISQKRRVPELRAVSPQLVWQACEPLVRELLRLCVSVVEQAPFGLVADLNDEGMVLCGGGALLPGLDKRLGDGLGIPCRIEESPGAGVVKGLAEYMAHTERYEKPLGWALADVARR